MVIVKVRDLKKRYGDKQAVDGISFDVEKSYQTALFFSTGFSIIGIFGSVNVFSKLKKMGILVQARQR